MITKEKITPALIPHQQFHKGSWLLSVKRPEWYYYMKNENPHHILNEDFLESVDPPLKELVDFLNRSGIETTPSCAGHKKSRKEFEKIYSALEKDREEIKKDGLKLRDIESGKIYLYKNKDYDLPWTRRAFVEKVMKYQENGVIGIRSFGKIKDKMLHIHIPGVKISQEDSIVLIETSEHTTQEIKDKWKKITKKIKSVLENETVTL